MELQRAERSKQRELTQFELKSWITIEIPNLDTMMKNSIPDEVEPSNRLIPR